MEEIVKMIHDAIYGNWSTALEQFDKLKYTIRDLQYQTICESLDEDYLYTFNEILFIKATKC